MKQVQRTWIVLPAVIVASLVAGAPPGMADSVLEKDMEAKLTKDGAFDAVILDACDGMGFSGVLIDAGKGSGVVHFSSCETPSGVRSSIWSSTLGNLTELELVDGEVHFEIAGKDIVSELGEIAPATAQKVLVDSNASQYSKYVWNLAILKGNHSPESLQMRALRANLMASIGPIRRPRRHPVVRATASDAVAPGALGAPACTRRSAWPTTSA